MAVYSLKSARWVIPVLEPADRASPYGRTRHSGLLCVALLAVVTLMSSACASRHAVEQPDVQSDPTLVELNQIAGEARATLGKLAYASNAATASVVTRDGMSAATLAATSEPSGWEQRVSLDYEGPFQVLIERLSLKAHYRYALYGKPPAVTPVVNISVKDAELIAVLRQVIGQVPDTVQVNVYPATRSVTVNFRG